MQRHAPLDPAIVAESAARAEPILAGTLCLMSAYRQNACPLLAQKIVCNLTGLARHPDLSPEFRRVCERLAMGWTAAPAGQQEAAGMFHAPDPTTFH